MTMYLELHHP